VDFRDKSVVITGASSGIGRELAVVLAGRGARLTLAARDERALAEAAAACESAGGRAVAVRADVAEEADCRRLVDEAVAAFGGLDALVNNAGISMWGRFDELEDLSMVDRIMRVNYLGSVFCTRYALAHLKRSKGLVVAISSLTGKFGVPTRSAYAASKHAVQGFFDSLRVELAETGVDVLVVSPGFVATPIRARALGPDGRPHGESPRDESRDTMSVEECVRLIVGAMERRDRELVMTAKGRLGLWLQLVAPRLVDRMALKALRERDRRLGR
jgi:NAD(P)-dependent dehydrogenase (short-subunit alcohol dehydrogenase family)